jgi:hypothetical protein
MGLELVEGLTMWSQAFGAPNQVLLSGANFHILTTSSQNIVFRARNSPFLNLLPSCHVPLPKLSTVEVRHWR